MYDLLGFTLLLGGALTGPYCELLGASTSAGVNRICSSAPSPNPLGDAEAPLQRTFPALGARRQRYCPGDAKENEKFLRRRKLMEKPRQLEHPAVQAICDAAHKVEA